MLVYMILIMQLILTVCVYLGVNEVKHGNCICILFHKIEISQCLNIVDSKLNYLPCLDYSRVSSIVRIDCTRLHVFKLQSSKATNSYLSLYGIVLKPIVIGGYIIAYME